MSEQTLRVLIVDTDADRRARIEETLGADPLFTVESVAEIEEAWKSVTQAEIPYQIALINDTMPAQDKKHTYAGIDLAEKIESRLPGTKIIILANEGNGDATTARDIDHSRFHFLSSSITPTEAVISIRRIAESFQSSNGASYGRLLNILSDTNALLLGSINQQEMLETVLRAIQSVGFDRVGLYLLSEDGKKLIGAAHAGMDDEFIGSEWPVTDDKTWRTLQPDSQPRLFTRELHPPTPLGRPPDTEGVEEWVYLPLFRQGKFIGVLLMYNDTSRQSLRENVLNVLPLFALQVALGIEKGYFEELDAQARNLQSILQIYTHINSPFNLEQALRAACQAAVQMLNVNHSWLMVFDAASKQGKILTEHPKRGATGQLINYSGLEADKKLSNSKEPQVIDDVETDTSLGEERQLLLKLNALSAIIVPVISNGVLRASLCFSSTGSQRSFTREETELCKVLATQVAIALETAQLYQNTKQRADKLEELQRTTQDFARSRTRTELLKTIMKHAVALLDAKGGGVYQYLPEHAELVIVADHHNPRNVGKALKLGEGMAGRLVQSGDAYMIVDSYDEWPGKSPTYTERGFGAVMEVPLKWHDTTIGILYVEDHLGRKFREDDANLLSLFADQAAIALANADLIARDEEKFQRLENMSKVTKEIMSDLGSKTLDDQLKLIAKHATEILEAEVCGVMLVEHEGFLSLVASYGHREGGFKKGRQFPIRCEPKGGLTGCIAWEGKLFNMHGEDLVNHFAVRNLEPDCTASGVCTALLAIPLKKRVGQEEKLLGLLRIGNKKSVGGELNERLGFTEEDEQILRIFAESAIIAIESSSLVQQLKEQRDDLKEQKDHLIRLVESSPNGIIAINRQGRITKYNELAKELLGYSDHEYAQLTVSQLYYDPMEPRRIGKRIHQSANGKIAGYETFLRTKDDRIIPIRISATWLYDAKNECIGSVGYFEDLRPIQQSEKQNALLLKISRIVAQEDDLSRGLQSLAQIAVPLLANTFCRILLFDEDQSSLRIEAAYPVSREDGSLNWKHGRGHSLNASEYTSARQLLKTKEPVIIRWNEKDAQPNLKGFTSHLGLGKNIQWLVLVPLMIEDNVVGVMELGEMRSEKRNVFSRDKLDLATDIAAQFSIFIKHRWLYENTERRRRFLAALDEKSRYLRGEKDLTKLRHEFVRLAVELVDGAGGALFTNHSKIRETELSVVYELPLTEGQAFLHEKGLVGLAARTHATQTQLNYGANGEREDLAIPFDFKIVVAVPLKYAGEVTDVLLVAGPPCKFVVTSIEVEILERFAAHASLAMQTSQQINKSDLFKHLHVLHQISEYVLIESELDKVLDAVLTGITAGYGLGFNRVALFLLTERGEYLEGRRGIGQVDKSKAEADWSTDIQNELYDFKSYLRQLESNPEPMTPIGQQIGTVRLPLKKGEEDIFSRVISKKKEVRVKAEELDNLPQRFNEVFKPETEMVVVPIAVRDRVMGLLVVDNKFTQSPISHTDIESLMTFVNTAAIAIDNHKLFHGSEMGREQLSSLFKASNALTSAKKPRLILEEIVERTREAAKAAAVIVILVDEAGRAHNVVHSTADAQYDIDQAIRPNGITMQVMSTGRPKVIENSSTYPGILNPMLLQDQSIPTAFLCLPLRMQGQNFGVMWIKYDEPRLFTDFEIDALKLYVNQAAIAYDNARRIEELEHMRQAAEALAGTTDDTQLVLVQIVESAHKVLQADSTVIWPYDAKSKSFIPENWVGSNIPLKIRKEFAKTEPREGGTAYTVMQHKWIGVRDVDDVQRYKFLGASTRRLLERIGVQSFLGIALTVGDENLGILYVNYNRPRSFSEEEEETARTFANHAALALKKAKLLEQVRKAKQAAEAVAKVTVLGDREATLNSITKETKAALDCDAVVLFEYDNFLQKLHHPPHMEGVIDERKASSYDEVKRDSIVYRILEMDKPAIVEDVFESELFNNKRFARDEGIRSCFATPLQADQQKVGVMFINYRSNHHFSLEETDNITLFANQAAIALGNAQLFDKRKKQLEEQDALVELSRALLGTIDLQEMMDRAVSFAARALDARYCCIMLPASDDELVFSAVHGWEEEMVNSFHIKNGTQSQTGYTMKIRTPVAVDDYDDNTQPFQIPPLVHQRHIKAGLSVPMFNADEVIGVMIAHSLDARHWTPEEKRVLSLIANQTAIAMKSAQQYRRSLRKSAYLKALYEAGQTITATFGPENSGFERKVVLDKLLEQAVQSFASIAGDGEVIGTLKLYNAETDELTFESVYPPDEYPALIAALGEKRWPKKSWQNGEGIGMTGRAILEKKPQVAVDVIKDPDYIPYYPATKSQVTIPLMDQGEIIGVLNLESGEQLPGFDDEDLENLVALADLAVIIIKRAKLHEELKQTKGLVGARTALAWMGMVYNAWRHTIDGYAVNIRHNISMARSDFKDWKISATRRGQLEKRLTTIADEAKKIIEKKSIPPLASEEKTEPAVIDDIIGERISQLWENDTYNVVKCQLDLDSEDHKVRISTEWFRRALDILVDNAVEAMAGCPEQIFTIATRFKEGQVEIMVSDTGKGIPPEMRDKIFKEQIAKPEGEKGFGIGLLMVQAIVQAYNGNISLKESTNHVGTRFIITFPSGG